MVCLYQRRSGGPSWVEESEVSASRRARLRTAGLAGGVDWRVRMAVPAAAKRWAAADGREVELEVRFGGALLGGVEDEDLPAVEVVVVG